METTGVLVLGFQNQHDYHLLKTHAASDVGKHA